MSRMETQPKLFQTTQTTGILYSTAVQRTWGTMVKQPSPVTATTGGSGAASLAPSAPAAPKPMPENPQELSMHCGLRAFQNCMYQLWLTPTSQQMMPSVGNTAWQSATTRSGRNGEVCISKFGATNFCHSARHLPMSAIHSLVEAFVPRRSTSTNS